MVDLSYDWMADPTFGPLLTRVIEEGTAKAVAAATAKAMAEARAEGLAAEQRLVRRQIEKRFGALPETARARIGAMSLAEIEDLSLRLLDATSVDEPFS